MVELVNKLLESKKTFKDYFEVSSTHNNHDIAFIYEEGKKTIKVTYKQYYEDCFRAANAVKEVLKNIEVGSYIGFQGSNSARWATLFWAIIIAGYNPVIINPLYNLEDSNRLLKESGAKAMISQHAREYNVPTFDFNGLVYSNEKLVNDAWGTKIAFCTSGTTGDSRIYVFTDHNICDLMLPTTTLWETNEFTMYSKEKGDLRLMSVVPFSHIYGFVAVFLWYSFYGFTIVFPKSLASNDIQECAQKHKITHIYGVPLLWDSLTKSIQRTILSKKPKMQDLINKFIDCNNHIITPHEAGFASSNMFRKMFQKKIFGTSIKFCVSGGSALGKDTLRIINGIGYNLNNGYGMTEVGVTSVELINEVEQRLKSSIGAPLAGVEYKIKDKELCIKSNQIHSYTLVNGKEIPALLDEEGFFHTGDIGEMDESGHTWLKGKIKDVVIGANGENIYPDEIAVRFNGIPFVNKFTVVGIQEGADEVLTLVAYLDRTLNEEELKQFTDSISLVNDSFPNSFKVRKVLISKNDLPVNTSMKIVKYELVENYHKNPDDFVEVKIVTNVSFDQFDPKEVEDIQNRVKKIIAKLFNIKPEDVGVAQNLITDLGGDSFIYMSLLAELENEFNISIPSELIGNLNTINEFTLFLLKNK